MEASGPGIPLPGRQLSSLCSNLAIKKDIFAEVSPQAKAIGPWTCSNDLTGLTGGSRSLVAVKLLVGEN
jgi:hypothetical protein